LIQCYGIELIIDVIGGDACVLIIRQMAKQEHNSPLTMIFSRLNLNGFLERSPPSVWARALERAFFTASAQRGTTPRDWLAVQDKNQFIADISGVKHHLIRPGRFIPILTR
jgi:hypothetical protein